MQNRKKVAAPPFQKRSAPNLARLLERSMPQTPKTEFRYRSPSPFHDYFSKILHYQYWQTYFQRCNFSKIRTHCSSASILPYSNEIVAFFWP